MLSSGQDSTLHRAPRCPGLRMVDRRWELFNRDVTHQVYVAPHDAIQQPNYDIVQATARYVLPPASVRYEPLPIPLAPGAWLVNVGKWVVLLRVEAPQDTREPATPDDQVPTEFERVSDNRQPGMTGSAPLPDAAARVHSFFAINKKARTAIAYYYQEFILGATAPQEVPMPIVAAALDLTGQGAVSDYKRKLQDCIWNEQGHQRELGEFLLINNLIDRVDVEAAKRVALKNVQNGRVDAARKRLKYRPAK